MKRSYFIRSEPKLSSDQRQLYETLKIGIREDIRAGLAAFTRAGEKLLRIRDERLDREEYDTFEAFSRDVLGHSKTYANNLIIGYNVVEALALQGETVLPDNERIARALAKFPKSDWRLIWKRARQIAGRNRPTYKTIHDAARDLVPVREVQKLWMSELTERLHTARKALTFNADFSSLDEEQMRELCRLLVELERQLKEHSIPALNRLDQLRKTKK